MEGYVWTAIGTSGAALVGAVAALWHALAAERRGRTEDAKAARAELAALEKEMRGELREVLEQQHEDASAQREILGKIREFVALVERRWTEVAERRAGR